MEPDDFQVEAVTFVRALPVEGEEESPDIIRKK
jgi:hypothetical protein